MQEEIGGILNMMNDGGRIDNDDDGEMGQMNSHVLDTAENNMIDDDKDDDGDDDNE